MQYKMKRVPIVCLLILAFALGSMNHVDTSAKILLCADNDESQVTSTERIGEWTSKAVLDQAQWGKDNNGNGEMFRRFTKRSNQTFLRRVESTLISTDSTLWESHSMLYWQDNPLTEGTSGHIAMIQCVHRKDGKKDNLPLC